MRNRLATLLSCSVLLLPILAVGQTSQVLVLKNRITLANVDGRMDHLGVDVQGRRLFVAANENHTVEVIDLQAGREVHTISDLLNPQGVFYDASTNRLFVTTEGDDGAVRIFDGTTFQPLHVVTLSSDADNIRYDASERRVLVGYGGEKFLNGRVLRGQGDGALAFLDSSGKKTGEIPIDAHPESFQIEKSSTRAFVNVPDRHEVQVVDLVQSRVLAHWPVRNCTDNFPMTLDEAHHRLFIGCRTPAILQVLNTENGGTVASFESVGSDDIFYDASKGRVYVLGTKGILEVFHQKDADHYDKIATYPTGLGAQTGLFVPEWGKLFVSTRRHGEQNAEILVYDTQ